MALRVYALYNRDAVVLWILGADLFFSIILCVMLVRTFFIARTDSYSFDALFQQWARIFQDETIPIKPPPIPHCVPYRSVKQCVFCRNLPRYRFFIDNAYRLFAPQRERSDIFSYHRISNQSLMVSKIALAAVWGLKPAFDLMVFFLTIRKSSTFKQTPRPVLIEVLIEDGTDPNTTRPF